MLMDFSSGTRNILNHNTNSTNNTPASTNGSWRASNSRGGSLKYVYDLPYFERKELCRILDENNQWEFLGGLMCYSVSELSEFGRTVYRGASPTDTLLTSWGSQNHTILELFTLLGKLQHFRAMRVIQTFVDPKYHVFIKDLTINVTAELAQQIEIQNPETPRTSGEKPIQVEEDKPKNREPDVMQKIPESVVGVLPQIRYDDLLQATENWDRRNILGKGGFGTVYRGTWKSTHVAIKRMEQRANQAFIESQLRQSLGELRFLNSYRHDNILPLYGYCLEGEHPCLVYQYMTNGSLEDRLLCRQRSLPLNWTTRYNIVRGVACGIQFLHSIGTKPLVHGDIKSANILLDKNFEPKVGDFGLAREMNPTTAGASYVRVSRVHGTRPYLPDEYLRSKKLSTKVDTFSFGIMLYEVLSGQRAYEESRPKKFLKEIFEESENPEFLKDQKAGIDNPDIFWILLRLAKVCTQRLSKERPEMVAVLKSLEGVISQASIRTVSSHVTGLPFLFETQQSFRPGSLLPTGTSTNPRLSPVDMRTPSPSPHWMPPHPYQQYQYQAFQSSFPKPASDGSGASLRRSPLSTHSSIPPVLGGGSGQGTPPMTFSSQPSNGDGFYGNHHHPQAFVGGTPEDSPRLQRAFVPLHPPPPTHIYSFPHPPTRYPEPRLSIIPSEDQYLPLVLQQLPIPPLSPGTGEESVEDSNEPMTVIPLITELGIKD